MYTQKYRRWSANPAAARRRWRRALVAAAMTWPLAVAAADRAPVILKADDAVKQGSAIKKWDRWVIWCGHNICDGSYTWTFPESGSYRLVWKEVGHKCAGASPYALYIDDEKKRASKIPQHGSCAECTPQNIVHNPGGRFGKRADIDLGTYQLRNGGKITLWAQNAFDCGIQNPGAYGGHFLELMALPAD
ncbi:MAG: hypothetical protein OEQ39_28260 [Gammaproteobacteria bacterium]|nr:hypothetical protein [Gammaproteobacteria bacterium]MDH3380826.1 hypothetical protein [Gammaproteobacteria bacterium]